VTYVLVCRWQQVVILRNITVHHVNVTLLVMPVLLGPADVIGYLGNNMGPNKFLLFENILQEDTFIW